MNGRTVLILAVIAVVAMAFASMQTRREPIEVRSTPATREAERIVKENTFKDLDDLRRKMDSQ